MPADLGALVADLTSETAALDRILVRVDAPGWDRLTPAPGWTVRDQITHLAFFDDAATTAATDPDRFRREREAAIADVDGFTDAIARRHAARPGAEVLAWFHRARAEMVQAYLVLEPSQRVPWYGPDMSAPSAVTARIMETWAHGLDVADALGVTPSPTAGLRQVAHLGVRTFANSFVVRGLDAPTTDVRVVLHAPDGEVWQWGPPDAADAVEGTAFDFCAVVTQRRHLASTRLVVTGPVAARWMGVAQAFAGPPTITPRAEER